RLWLRVDRRLLALERLRMGLGERPLGAPARGLPLRAAVLRLYRWRVRVHARLLVAAGSRAVGLAGSRSPRPEPAVGRHAAAGLAHAESAAAASGHRWRGPRAAGTDSARRASDADRARANASGRARTGRAAGAARASRPRRRTDASG